MKTLVIVGMILLSGCSMTVPVKRNFPAVPPALTQACEPLKKLQGDTVTIVDLHSVVVENYTIHHECSIKVDAWNEWYNTQKSIFDSVK